MTAKRRSLSELFDAARKEQTPLSAADAQKIVADAAATSAARSPFMSPALLATSAAALVIAAGVTVKVIHDDAKKPQPNIAATSTSISTPPSMTPPVTSHPGNSAPQSASAIVDAETDGGNDGSSEEPNVRVVKHRVMMIDDDNDIDFQWTTDNMDLAVFALRADADMFKSLGLEPSAVQSICKSLAGADSVTDCSFDHPEPQMKICMFTEGTTDEVVFMDRPGPMPVMFTSSDGKGRVVASKFMSTTDPNKLVPVAAPGCGSNMLMWFEPTEEFVFSMPDSLGSELEQVIDMEIRIETKDGKTRVTQRTKNADGTVTEEVETIDAIDDQMVDMTDQIEQLKQSRIIINSELEAVNIDSILAEAQSQVKNALGNSVHIQMKKMNNGVEVLELNLDNEIVKIRKDMLANSIQLRSNPAINRRVIILSSRTNTLDPKKLKSTPPAPPAPVMLQESRFGQGAVVSTEVYPNPTADGGATLSFSLSEPRTLSLELLNINGESVAQLATNVNRAAGSGQIAFPLQGVAPGMYLVSLTTDKGERAVQRLIVQ